MRYLPVLVFRVCKVQASDEANPICLSVRTRQSHIELVRVLSLVPGHRSNWRPTCLPSSPPCIKSIDFGCDMQHRIHSARPVSRIPNLLFGGLQAVPGPPPSIPRGSKAAPHPKSSAVAELPLTDELVDHERASGWRGPAAASPAWHPCTDGRPEVKEKKEGKEGYSHAASHRPFTISSESVSAAREPVLSPASASASFITQQANAKDKQDKDGWAGWSCPAGE